MITEKMVSFGNSVLLAFNQSVVEAEMESTSRSAAISNYAGMVPSYLTDEQRTKAAAGDLSGFTGIYQAFTVGRVRFLLTDLRSTANTETQDPFMLQSEQLIWFKAELKKWQSYAMASIVRNVGIFFHKCMHLDRLGHFKSMEWQKGLGFDEATGRNLEPSPRH